MKARQEKILAEVVRCYLDSGRPVPSGMIARRQGVGLSPASVRNVMSELERLGLLFQPHTSSGRVPTDAGLRYFVDRLMVMDEGLKQSLERIVTLYLRSETEQEALLRRATDELATLTRFAGLVWVRRPLPRRIRRLELVPVGSECVLALIVTDSGRVRNRLLHRSPRLDDRGLERLSVRLNTMLQNCSLKEARLRLQQEMRSDQLHIRRLLADLKKWTDAPIDEQEDVIVSGQRQLLNMPEFGVSEAMRSLLAALEEKEQLLRLVTQVEREENGVRVFIGREHALDDMEQAAVVLARYEGPMHVTGTVGVIGPKRMHYEHVLSLVECTAKRITWMLGGMH